MKLEKLTILGLFILSLILISSCSKLEPLFDYNKFRVDPPPVVPPRKVDANPDNVRSFKAFINGDSINDQAYGKINKLEEETPFSKNHFYLKAKISDNQYIQIFLPLNDSSQLDTGKYMIRNSDTVKNTKYPYSFFVSIQEGLYKPGTFSSRYNLLEMYDTDTSTFKFDFNLTITEFDPQKKLITGFLDTLSIINKETNKKFSIEKGEFSFYYNFFDIYLNGKLQKNLNYEFETSVLSNKEGGWPSEFNTTAFTDFASINFFWQKEHWTDELISRYKTDNGKGKYELPYIDISKRKSPMLITLYSDFNNYAPTTPVNLNFEQFNEQQYIKGNIITKIKKLKTSYMDENTIPNFEIEDPEIELKMEFSNRIIFWTTTP